MRIIADTHCHTISSGHAYSTLMENLSYAKKRGLYAMAVTDHTGDMQGAPYKWYFGNMDVIPKEIDGVKILRGAEVNVIDKDGILDLEEDILKRLDWVVASIHDSVTTISGTDESTNAWLNIAKNPMVNVIGHSGSPKYEYDYETVIKEFGKNGKLVELNNSTFSIRKSYTSNCKKIAELCKKHSVPVVLNSDSHFCTNIGNVANCLKMLEEIDFPEELVVNANVDRFEKYLREWTGYFNNK